VKLPVFEGPFELLFHLINKEEVNIWEIPLAKITEEYLLYLQSMQELQIDLAGEFLVMAASLLYLKSQLLLPQPPSFSPEEEVEALFFGSKEELVRSLLEYKRFKLIAAKLKEREDQQKRIFLRSPALPRVIIVNRQCSLYPHDLESLKDALQQIKKKNVKKTEMISLPEEIPFSHKLREIVSRLRKKGFFKYYLDDFLDKKEKKEIVLTFFVLLELAKRGRVSLQQQKIFGEICVLPLN
jgi:segregation and condensation protein A